MHNAFDKQNLKLIIKIIKNIFIQFRTLYLYDF